MRLRLTGPNGERREIDATGKSRLDIGRGHDADVRIASLTVSRVHCRVSVQKGGAVVEDLGSSYGTMVNHIPISGPTMLGNDDQVCVGSWIIQLLDAPEAANDERPVERVVDTRKLRVLSSEPKGDLDALTSAPAAPSVWTTSHLLLIGSLGLIALALVVFIILSSN